MMNRTVEIGKRDQIFRPRRSFQPERSVIFPRIAFAGTPDVILRSGFFIPQDPMPGEIADERFDIGQLRECFPGDPDLRGPRLVSNGPHLGVEAAEPLGGIPAVPDIGDPSGGSDDKLTVVAFRVFRQKDLDPVIPPHIDVVVFPLHRCVHDLRLGLFRLETEIEIVTIVKHFHLGPDLVFQPRSLCHGQIDRTRNEPYGGSFLPGRFIQLPVDRDIFRRAALQSPHAPVGRNAAILSGAFQDRPPQFPAHEPDPAQRRRVGGRRLFRFIEQFVDCGNFLRRIESGPNVTSRRQLPDRAPRGDLSFLKYFLKPDPFQLPVDLIHPRRGLAVHQLAVLPDQGLDIRGFVPHQFGIDVTI